MTILNRKLTQAKKNAVNNNNLIETILETFEVFSIELQISSKPIKVRQTFTSLFYFNVLVKRMFFKLFFLNQFVEKPHKKL